MDIHTSYYFITSIDNEALDFDPPWYVAETFVVIFDLYFTPGVWMYVLFHPLPRIIVNPGSDSDSHRGKRTIFACGVRRLYCMQASTSIVVRLYVCIERAADIACADCFSADSTFTGFGDVRNTYSRKLRMLTQKMQFTSRRANGTCY